MEHASTPWKVENGAILEANGHAVVDFRYDIRKEDIEFMVTAVNSYDMLIDTLVAIVTSAYYHYGERQGWGEIITMARHAIEKAEQEELKHD